MKKKQLYIILFLLSILTIVFVSLFGVYWQSYHRLDQSLIKDQDNSYGGHELRIISKTLNNTQEMDQIYTSNKEHKNAVDLMLDVNAIHKRQNTNNSDIFEFSSEHNLYGYMLLGVNGLKAIYDQGSWWKILSPTLEGNVEYSRDWQFDVDANIYNSWMTNVGLSNIWLTKNIILIFVETKSNDYGF